MSDRKPSTWLNYGPFPEPSVPDRREYDSGTMDNIDIWESPGAPSLTDHERINRLANVVIAEFIIILVLAWVVLYLLVR